MEKLLSRKQPSQVKPKPKSVFKPPQHGKKNVCTVDMKNRSAGLQIDRSALIKFNEMNLALPVGERHTWQRVLASKDGTVRKEDFDRIVDNKSLECLLSNPAMKAVVDTILVKAGGPKVDIGTNIRKKYWVFLKNDKLTTLSTDFKGGVGSAYLWTEDALLKAPSAAWRLPAKRDNDPRRRFIDPRTKLPWVPKNTFVTRRRAATAAAAVTTAATTMTMTTRRRVTGRRMARRTGRTTPRTSTPRTTPPRMTTMPRTMTPPRTMPPRTTTTTPTTPPRTTTPRMTTMSRPIKNVLNGM